MSLSVLRIACCLLVLLTACERVKPAAPQPAPEPANPYTADYDADNLLNLARGAAVVSRTGEFTLENSAAHAIDGDWLTFFKSPPAGAEQTLVFSLPARSRIDRLGAVTTDVPSEAPQQLRFEASDDGIAWRDARTIDVIPVTGPQIVKVAPFEAVYLRVQIVEPNDSSSFLRSILVKGSPARPGPSTSLGMTVGGCWTINGMPAKLEQRGSSVSGVIGNDIQLSGGFDGRTLRAMWRRGPMWGRAILTFDPQRRAVSGVRWFEDVVDFNRTDAWFGTRAAQCGKTPLNETEIASAILTRARKWTMYGDDAYPTALALLQRSPSQRFRIVAHSEARLNAARAALKSPRLEFALEPKETYVEPQRALADGVELQLR